jgi:apolipoprotein D and lipocalin family protein
MLAALCVGLCLFLTGCAGEGPPLQLSQSVDLNRYAGRWYIIANIPYFAENGKIGSYFDVSFTPDGKLTDIYNGRDKSFDAKVEQFTMKGYVKPNTGNALWRESPFWPLYFSYPILFVDPDYSTALVGYPGRDYGWVLSRQPTMDDALYQSLLGKFQAEGYNIAAFKRVPQFPDQIGKPGFQ